MLGHKDYVFFFENIGSEKPHNLLINEKVYHDLLVFYKDSLSNKQKQDLNLVFEDMLLYKAFLGSEYAVNTNPARNISLGIAQTLGILESLTGWKKALDASLNEWQFLKKGLIVDSIFSMFLGSKFIITLRHVGNFFADSNGDDQYKFKGVSQPNELKSSNAKKTDSLKKRMSFSGFFVKNPEYIDWEKFLTEYLESKMLKNTKSDKAAQTAFMNYVLDTTGITSPIEFFSKPRTDFYEWLKEHGEGQTVSYSKCMQNFSIWFVDKYLVDKDDDEYTYIGFTLFNEQRFAIISKEKNAETKATNSETNKIPMPTKYVALCKQILTENDYAFPKSLDFEYFRKDGESIWCPVNTFITLIMLEMPLRRIQVKLLDSGEGDQFYYNDKLQAWEDNPSINANYWKKTNAKVVSRGILKRSTSDLNGVDLYINTNKTQDRDTGFGEHSGYTIPWNNEIVISLVNEMRRWQEKHNPITEPRSAVDCPSNTWANRYTTAALKATPDRFYLFRSPLGDDPESPPADFRHIKLWNHLIWELEKRLNDLGEDVKLITKFNSNVKHKDPTSAVFTPHGLRVTGLTAFMEAGVPIEILSKIVAGHASVLMTLHYIKYNNAHISNVLNDAQKNIEDQAQEQHRLYLAEDAWTDAHKYSVFNDENVFASDWEAGDKQRALWENRQIGLCPNSGTSCNTGGEVIRKSGSNNKHVYGPVQGGEGNCIMCRYFITGKPWLVPLWIKSNELLAQSRELSEKLENERIKSEELKKERFEIVKTQGAKFIPHELKTKIHQSESLLDRLTVDLGLKLDEAHRAYNLTEKVRQLPNKGSTENALAVIDSSDDEFEFDEVSRFKQNDFMVQASRLYSHVDSKVFEMERNHFIDTVMFQSDMTPIGLSQLSEEEKKSAADAASQYLLANLTDKELTQIENKTVTLKQLGFDNRIKQDLKGTVASIGDANKGSDFLLEVK